MKDRNGVELQKGHPCKVVDNTSTGVSIGDIGIFERQEFNEQEGDIAIIVFTDAICFEQGLLSFQLEIIGDVREKQVR